MARDPSWRACQSVGERRVVSVEGCPPGWARRGSDLKQAVASGRTEAGDGAAALLLPDDKGCRRLYAPNEGRLLCLALGGKMDLIVIA